MLNSRVVAKELVEVVAILVKREMRRMIFAVLVVLCRSRSRLLVSNNTTFQEGPKREKRRQCREKDEVFCVLVRAGTLAIT